MARRDAALKILKSQPFSILSKGVTSREPGVIWGKGLQLGATQLSSGGCHPGTSAQVGRDLGSRDTGSLELPSNALSINEGVTISDDLSKVRACSISALSGNGMSVKSRTSCLGARLASNVVFLDSERDSDDQGAALLQAMPSSSLHAPPVQSAQRIRQPQQSPRFSTPKLLIGKVCQVLRDTEWGQGTEEALQELGVYFTPSLVNEVLRCQQDVDKAMGFFEYVRKQPYYSHNSRTHAKMLTLLGAARRYDDVQRLVESMQKDRTKLDTQLFNTLIHIYGEANMMEKALQTLAAFTKEGGRPTAYTYSSMIQVFMKGGDVQNGLLMYKQMLKAKFVPDHTTFNILIDSLAKADQVSDCC